ncbi:putative quinone oxidoreductase, YhdH/YhfP family [Ignavigranum ruoffiae]|uniref:Putative quinone oxidoreductase, YhdH/YhfP family n=1 Tax=Ignavigranum ruoffiae TaxID=89093 RepID=A0A1H9F7C8_9LACT|nr:YhdH/YhfP family quinone oxidoreductase [Ignavigranum ruoffiae]SEQ33769.1 putative quinone oxidoreductase, YhdH/YhfP family [Ignavigranum ruoffiae]
MKNFKALRVSEHDGEIVHQIETVTREDLHDGDVLVKVHYSSLNYKDMLAVQAKGGVIRSYPMIPGIDFAGVVEESSSDQFKEGQEVIVTGFGTGVSHTGGLAEYAQVPSEWIVPLPQGLSLKDSMVIGTAGFTAALSIEKLEQAGLKGHKDARILVTGSTGGVGSIALQMLKKAGYQNVSALVRKDYQVEVAEKLGADQVLFPDDIPAKARGLAKQAFDYVLDTVGGEVASMLIPQIQYGGAISMCGNAGGVNIDSSVFPFILRGVSLLGVDSVQVPIEDRPALWQRISQEWNVANTQLSQTISLDQVPESLEKLKAGQHLGRTIVEM